MNRREVLQSGSVAIAVGLSGCIGKLQSGESNVFEIHNETARTRTVGVTVFAESSDETLFEQTVELTASSDSRTFSVEGASRYVVEVTIDGEYTTSFPWSGGSCPDSPFLVIIYGDTAIDRQSPECDDWF